MKGGKELMANDGKALKEKLFKDKKNGWQNLSDEELRNIFQYGTLKMILINIIGNVLLFVPLIPLIQLNYPGKDISIIGFDGMDVSCYYNPGITTIKQPKKEMAEKSVELLFDLLKGKCENKRVLLNTQLIERESCADLT